MPRAFIELPDGKKLGIRFTDQDPDNPGEIINFQEGLRADIPSYLVVADNVSLSNNTNLLSVFNNVSGKRIRIEKITAYARSTANNTVVLQIGYINQVPTGGTDAIFTPFAADYPPNPAAPNGVISKVLPTAPNPIGGLIFGGDSIALVSGIDLRRHDLFKVEGNGSALILRPQQDGITVRQVAGTNQGNVTIEVMFTID